MARVSFALFCLYAVLLQNFVQAQKAGTCPRQLREGICGLTCLSDYYCPRSEKCCRTKCGGAYCTPPALPDIPEKPGNCPPPAASRWVCSSRCFRDSDCPEDNKCCTNKCGALACMVPET